MLSPSSITYRMPYGSVKGPLSFTIYDNQLSAHVNSAACYLYADDTTIVLYDSDEFLMLLINVCCLYLTGKEEAVTELDKNKIMLIGSQQE